MVYEQPRGRSLNLLLVWTLRPTYNLLNKNLYLNLCCFVLEEGMAAHSRIIAWRIRMDRGAWRATVHGVAKSQTRLSD